MGLIEIVDRKHHQFDLLHPGQTERSDHLMAVMDKINRVEGKGTVFLASQGIHKPWYMRQQFASPQYTTKWNGIPIVVT